jgi:hypothetical protein
MFEQTCIEFLPCFKHERVHACSIGSNAAVECLTDLLHSSTFLIAWCGHQDVTVVFSDCKMTLLMCSGGRNWGGGYEAADYALFTTIGMLKMNGSC